MATRHRWFWVRAALVSALIGLVTVIPVGAGSAATVPVGRFVYSDGGHLKLLKSDGSGAADITPAGCTDAWEPDWKSDGSRIVFANRCGASGQWSLASVKPNGTDFQVITEAAPGDESRPEYSPDGSKIVYSNPYGTWNLFVANADGSNPVELSHPGSDDFPTWSPDGKHIAFASDASGHFQIYVMGADGSNVQRLTHTNRDNKWLQWSADGTRIYFTSGPSDSNSDIYWTSANGKTTMRVTSDHLSTTADLSADGSRLITSGADGISVMDADGTNGFVLTTGTEPDWDPTTLNDQASLWVEAIGSGHIGASVQLSGALSIPGSSVSGVQLSVYATPPGGTRSSIGHPSTTAQGGFKITTTPGKLGDWLYEVVWDGDATHDPVSYGVHYGVTTSAAHITLSLSKPSIQGGETLKVQTHVTQGPDNALVSVYSTPANGRRHLIDRGHVNSHGVMTTSSRPTVNSTYQASFDGSTGWKPSKSGTESAIVHATWRAKSLQADGRSGKYALYDYTTSCHGPRYIGCPWEEFFLSPKHAGVPCSFTFEYLVHGHWHSTTYRWRLTSKSNLLAVTSYSSPDIIGVAHRVRATFRGDKINGSATSDWVYWKVRR